MVIFVFFFKQKTAYEITTGDWSSDVCSSDLTVTDSVAWISSLDPFPTSTPSASHPWRSEERRVGKECGCCVDLGGRRIIKKKKKKKKNVILEYYEKKKNGEEKNNT